MSPQTLGWLDYVIIATMLAISSCIGLYYRFTGGRQKTTREYFTADKSMNVLTVGIGLVVSFMSAITLLGVSEENYSRGTQFAVINIAYLIGTPIVCYGFLPVFYNLDATSAYEYLEKRFGYGCRFAASFMCWLQLLLYSGVVLLAPSLAIQATTQMPLVWSVIVIGVVCTFYSTVGGIKAVLITDVFQGILMLGSVIVIIIAAAIDVGGLSEIWRIAHENQRVEFDNFSIDPTERHTVWDLVIGGLCTYLSLYAVNQVQVQRLLTVKDLKSARLSLWICWPILMVLSVTTCFSGLAIFSRYYKCDPLASKKISKPDMLMPYYVMDTLSKIPGMPGFFIAGIFSAGLSTISASLNSLAAVSLEDYIKPTLKLCGRELTDNRNLLLSKILAFAYGIICIILAFVAMSLGNVLQVSLTVFGVVGGPLLGTFTLGMLFECANEIGAIIGLLSSTFFLLWIAFGKPRPPLPNLPVSVAGCDVISNVTNILHSNTPSNPSHYFYLYRISYMWYSAIGFILTILIGLLISLLLRKNDKDLDPDLFFPFKAKNIRKKKRKQTEINGNLTSNSTYLFNQNFQMIQKVEEDSQF